MKTFVPLLPLALLIFTSCGDSPTRPPHDPAQTPASAKAATPPVAPEPPANTAIVINGKTLTSTQLAEFKLKYKAEPKPGSYWYDSVSGLYGNSGQAAFGFMHAGHDYGTLAEDASGGNTGIFVNGRQLPQNEWLVWSTVLGAAIQPGRYWLDAKGNAGYEGNPNPTVNLYAAAAQAAQNRAGGGGRGGGDNFWSTRFSAGNYNDDNSAGYVSIPGQGVIGSYGY